MVLMSSTIWRDIGAAFVRTLGFERERPLLVPFGALRDCSPAVLRPLLE